MAPIRNPREAEPVSSPSRRHPQGPPLCGQSMSSLFPKTLHRAVLDPMLNDYSERQSVLDFERLDATISHLREMLKQFNDLALQRKL